MSSPPDTTPIEDSPAASSASSQQQNPQNPPEAAADNLTEKLEKMNISSTSFSIWPPTQRTREAVINRLIETLSTPSVLSKRYGSMPADEASSTARAIEEEAYNTAASSAAGGVGDDMGTSIDVGIEILQVYSKEISKRMLVAVKSRASATATPPTSDVSPAPETIGTVTATDDVSSSVDNESSS